MATKQDINAIVQQNTPAQKVFIHGIDENGDPALLQINSDGSLNISGSISAVSSPDKETPYIVFICNAAFTGASVGHRIAGILTLNTVNQSLTPAIYYNFDTDEQITVADKTKLTAVASNSLTSAELAAMTLKTSSVDIGVTTDTAATTDTGSFTLISLFKRFLSVKLPSALTTGGNLKVALQEISYNSGNVDSTTQRVTLTNDGTFATLSGAVTETAPATDTASSGLNGRLQRIAQRFTSLIGLFPSSLSNGFFQVSLKESIAVALAAGSQVIGKVGIDQTTDGTTNFVRIRGKLTTLSDGLVISIATGGTAVTAIAADANGYHYFLQNTSTGDLWYSTLATAVLASPSIRLSPGDSYETPVNLLATGALSVIGATTGQTFTVRKW